ncbi:MAG: DEAD/DEAH box helicase [Exilibacterium sp.]
MQLGITPSRRLRCFLDPNQAASGKLTKAFEHSLGAGLFQLAAQHNTAQLPPDLRFWHQFACDYMTERCQRPETDGELKAIAFTTSPVYEQRLAGAPPMIGAEYLSSAVFEYAWDELDNWLCEQVMQSGGPLGAYLKKHAPQWHQVGRVCFHLAENKKDTACPFAFMATYVPQLGDGARARHQPLGKALQQYAGASNKSALINLLSPVHLASKSSALIGELVESGDIYYPLAWTPTEAYRFLKEVPLYEASGLSVRLPDWWKKRPRPRVKVSVGGNVKSGLSADSLLSFDVSMSLDDQSLSQRELEELMAAEEGLVLLKGQWVEVDGEKLSQTLAHWQKVERQVGEEGISFIEGMRLLAGSPMDLSPSGAGAEPEQEWMSVQAGAELNRTLERLRSGAATQGLPRPGRALRAKLRPYQEVGVNWLWQLSQLKLGACLADDMGLGKTIQIIALLLVIKKAVGKGQTPAKPSLLVLPASLLGNWKDELEKFAPSLNTLFVHPSQKRKQDTHKSSQEIRNRDTHVSKRDTHKSNRDTRNQDTHVSKQDTHKSNQDTHTASQNPQAAALQDKDLVITTYGILRQQPWLLDQDWRLAVLDEAQAIKNPASQQTRAVKKLRAEARIALTGTPVENRLSDLWSLFDFICPGLLGTAKRFQTFAKSLSEREHDQYAPLRNLVQPYILRRLKTDKSIIDDLPDKTELHAYCGLAKKQAALYKKSVQELTAVLKKEEDEEVSAIKRRGIVLSYLLRFKQICNHPAQWLGDGQYAPQESGKFNRLAALCEEIAARQEKVLVFTQFREMTEPLAAFLSDCFGRPGLILHGGTSVAQRKKRVDQFQSEEGPPFFVLSIKAGGTGLNLTQASHVVHFDRWWNPAVENQATDRAFRIGQKRNVLVHKFVCRGTVEERIDALITEKQSLANDVIEGGGESLLTEMSNDELIDMVSLDLDKINISE